MTQPTDPQFPGASSPYQPQQTPASGFTTQESPYQSPYAAQQEQTYPGQQPGYGQPSFQPTGTPKKGGKGGKITFFIGLAMLIISIVCLTIGFTQLVKLAAPMANGGNQFTTTTTVKGGQSSDRMTMIVAESPTAPSCTVTAPDGSNVPLQTNASGSNNNASTVGAFNASQSGDYKIKCSGAKNFTVLEIDAAKMIVPGVLVLVGFIGGFIGFIVALIGLILWLTGRKKVTYV